MIVSRSLAINQSLAHRGISFTRLAGPPGDADRLAAVMKVCLRDRSQRPHLARCRH